MTNVRVVKTMTFYDPKPFFYYIDKHTSTNSHFKLLYFGYLIFTNRTQPEKALKGNACGVLMMLGGNFGCVSNRLQFLLTGDL